MQPADLCQYLVSIIALGLVIRSTRLEMSNSQLVIRSPWLVFLVPSFVIFCPPVSNVQPWLVLLYLWAVLPCRFPIVPKGKDGWDVVRALRKGSTTNSIIFSKLQGICSCVAAGVQGSGWGWGEGGGSARDQDFLDGAGGVTNIL